MHRAHYELTKRAMSECDANLLIHPVVGMTKPNDLDYFTRVRCYEAILDQYPNSTVRLSLLNLAMRMAGPREAIWHGLIRKNYGCSHIIVGRDHAGPGKDSNGDSFYDPLQAQDLFENFQDELGIKMIKFNNLVWNKCRSEYKFIASDKVSDTSSISEISGTELRDRLDKGRDIPEWFSFPEVIAELRRAKPPKNKRGITVFFTGLSGSGKTTVANALSKKLLEIGGRKVSILDGDDVRKHLSSELGFSKKDRDLNVLRIGYVASEITKHNGIAICAPIAPYEATRDLVRKEIEQFGTYIEVHVATELDVCERRDPKGLYKLARAGKIISFTGISDPYEIPKAPDIRINTGHTSVESCVDDIIAFMECEHLITGNKISDS